MATSERKQEAHTEALNLWNVCRVGGNLGSQSFIRLLKMFRELMKTNYPRELLIRLESDLTLACNLGPTGCAYDFAELKILTVICIVHFFCQSDSGCVVQLAASDRGRRKRCRS